MEELLVSRKKPIVVDSDDETEDTQKQNLFGTFGRKDEQTKEQREAARALKDRLRSGCYGHLLCFRVNEEEQDGHYCPLVGLTDPAGKRDPDPNKPVAIVYERIYAPHVDWDWNGKSELLVKTTMGTSVLINQKAEVDAKPMWNSTKQLRRFEVRWGGDDNGSPCIFYEDTPSARTLPLTLELIEEGGMHKDAKALIDSAFQLAEGLPLPAEAIPFLAVAKSVSTFAQQAVTLANKDATLGRFPLSLNTAQVGKYIVVGPNQGLGGFDGIVKNYRYHVEEKAVFHKTDMDPLDATKSLELPTVYCLLEVKQDGIDPYKNFQAAIKAAELAKPEKWSDLVAAVADGIKK